MTWGEIKWTKARWILAAVAGLLLAAAFPNWNIAGFAWIAPALMLVAAIGSSGSESFRIGFVAGLVFWLASLYWLLCIPVTGFPILAWIALSAYVALFQGVWVWLCWKCFPTAAARAARERDLPSALHGFNSASRLSRFGWALLCAALWVALEMIRTRFLSGFPWSLLGVSQYQMTPLLHISSFTGVYGVSFLVVWTSVSLLSAGLLLLRPSASRTMLFAEVVPPLLVVSIVFATGYHRLTHTPESGRTIRLTSIQPSIPQTMIWDSSANAKRFAELMTLTESALSNQADALLWPEAALPELSEANFGALTNLAGTHNTWFIFGADDVQYRPGSTNKDDLLYYNAAWLLSPGGQIADIYYKRRLVIFGEYIPLADWLPFIKWFTPITGGFEAGTNASQFALNDAQVIAAPLICFEDCFPHGAREHVTEDTDLLVNLTNDGWFGEAAEQWQHAANAVFRAIENGLPLVRSCNNGVTCWIDPQGRIRDILRDKQGTIYGAGHITFTIPLNPRPPSGTFYTRHGDVFGWACVALSMLAVAGSCFRSQGSRQN
jgi:apolipoprotein N-acyltransferase